MYFGNKKKLAASEYMKYHSFHIFTSGQGKKWNPLAQWTSKFQFPLAPTKILFAEVVARMEFRGQTQTMHSRTSLIRTPKGQNEVSALERCPYWRSHYDDVTLKSPQYFRLHCIVFAFANVSFENYQFYMFWYWYHWMIKCQCLCNGQQEMVHIANYRHLVPECRNREVKFVWICCQGPRFGVHVPFYRERVRITKVL